MQFSWFTAIAVFFAYVGIDTLYALYINAVGRKLAVRAANFATLMALLVVFGIRTYMENGLYVFPLLAGGWIGTFLTVRLVKQTEEIKN